MVGGRRVTGAGVWHPQVDGMHPGICFRVRSSPLPPPPPPDALRSGGTTSRIPTTLKPPLLPQSPSLSGVRTSRLLVRTPPLVNALACG